MATCKDCFHFEACGSMLKSLGFTVDGDGKDADKRCKEFKHKDDVAEVKHGWWYWDADSETGHNLRRCSECHSGSGWARNYCAECGAKMDGKRREP